MASINTVVLSGRVKRDAEVNPNGTIARFTVCCWARQKDQSGNWQSVYDYFTCKSFQKGSFDRLKDGEQVTLQGHLKTDSWQDKSGTKKYQLTVYVDSLDFPMPKKEASYDEYGNYDGDEDAPF